MSYLDFLSDLSQKAEEMSSRTRLQIFFYMASIKFYERMVV